MALSDFLTINTGLTTFTLVYLVCFPMEKNYFNLQELRIFIYGKLADYTAINFMGSK